MQIVEVSGSVLGANQQTHILVMHVENPEECATTIESLPEFTRPARQRWESISADIRQRLLTNVWYGQYPEAQRELCQILTSKHFN